MRGPALACFGALVWGQAPPCSAQHHDPCTCSRCSLEPRSECPEDSVSPSAVWEQAQDTRSVGILGISDRRPPRPGTGQMAFSTYRNLLDGVAGREASHR